MKAARELEIQVLERVAKIDAEIADSLRDNISTHFRDGAELLPLPHPVEIDDECRASALRKCPRRETLTLEEQLQLKHRDNEDWHQTRNPDHGLDWAHDIQHRYEVAELERKIAERDR